MDSAASMASLPSRATGSCTGVLQDFSWGRCSSLGFVNVTVLLVSSYGLKQPFKLLYKAMRQARHQTVGFGPFGVQGFWAKGLLR